MKIDSNSIQRLLDGEVPEEERDELLRLIQRDPALRREYDELGMALALLEQEGRCAAPPGFTAGVMGRLPVRVPTLGQQVRGFLFERRTLRWNMASALAGLALIAAVLWFGTVRDRDLAAPVTASKGDRVIVRLSFYAPQARQVAVAGDFNKWTVGGDLMDRRDGGLWTIDLTLQPGRYSYMFVLDGKAWVTDPGADSYQDDGFGNRNAVMKIST